MGTILHKIATDLALTPRQLLGWEAWPNDGTSEYQYLALLEDAFENGGFHGDRTGVGTLALHGRTMRFSLANGFVPLLTTKRVAFKSVLNELFWFLRGDSNIRWLLENKVTIWSEWPHKKFVEATGGALTQAEFDARVAADETFAEQWEDLGLETFQQLTGEALSVKEFEARILASDAFAEQWGDLGPVYGAQWRRWMGSDGKVYDQITDVLERIKRDPNSRRLLFHGWNVAEVDQMALPPCHLLYQFFVEDGKLSLSLYQRSCDTGLGVPFNIASAAFLVHMVAQQVGLEPGELFWVGHDVHVYANHGDLKQQLERTPRAFPQIRFKRKPDSLFDYCLDDLEFVTPYDPDPNIKLPVAV
jgi:thymidylate synthase